MCIHMGDNMSRMNMPRRRFLGTAAAGVGAAAMGMAGTARAVGGDEPWDNKVYPEISAINNYKNIQNAVNRGGVVRLMATDRTRQVTGFDLTGLVRPNNLPIFITRDVTIIGQNTKIRADSAVFSCNEDVKLSIRNIRFFTPIDVVPVSPLNLVQPVSGSVQLDISNVAVGGDEPWD